MKIYSLFKIKHFLERSGGAQWQLYNDNACHIDAELQADDTGVTDRPDYIQTYTKNRSEGRNVESLE